MKKEDFYYVREFARLAGVTVRTLQYYDNTGLLKPARLTEAGHRLYQREDLLRLQQILTLKYMGFSLDQIWEILSSPTYNLPESIHIQKQAIDQQIKQLQEVSEALGEVMEIVAKKDTEQIDWQKIIYIIQAVRAKKIGDWAMQYYTPEQQSFLMERAKHYTQEQALIDHQRWQTLIIDLQEKRHLRPEHPQVQALMERMDELISEFTEGDQEIAQSLKNMYDNIDKMPENFLPYDAEMQKFINRAMEIYQQNKSKFT